MKKILIIISGFILLISSQLSNAQDTPDYFVGDWKVVIQGTPNGDAKMEMHLERIDGTLTGNIKNEGMDAITISKVEEKEESITVYYSAVGYDVNMLFKKKDPNNIDGSLMDMFDLKGERVVKK